ncbi:MAG: hypothetical protein ISR51_05440 [Rhodospirillales bacterium]|nr:hypothetical protein [Alphaproteobacteria bacterium]MBL6948102.1 hypothetical protein [Rhodospirillales bacterium]
MPQLTISEDVMERLRAACRDGEADEAQTLRRLLGCPPEPASGSVTALSGPTATHGDFIDATYGVRFPEGFRIFRTYKGHAYAARVTGGRWVLEGGGPAGAFNSLNRLSQAVIDGNENAWMFWFYQNADGQRRRISELRDPALVQRRPRRNLPRETTLAPIGQEAPMEPPEPAPPLGSGGKPWEPA